MSTYIINTEPEASSAADADEMLIFDATVNRTRKLGLDNLHAYTGGGVVNIGDNTSYTALAANSGKTHFIPDLTGDLTISLPTGS